MGVLDVDAEALERQDGVAADVGAGVESREVEVAALVEHLGAAVVAEEVVLQLGADVEGVIELFVGDRERLQLPEDVGEPQAYEADAVLLDERLDVFRCLGSVSHSGWRLMDRTAVAVGRAVGLSPTSGPPRPSARPSRA